MTTPDAYAGPSGHGRPPQNGIGIAALIIGIIAIPFGFLVIGGGLGLFATVLGIVGRSKVRRGKATNPGVALAGIITGTIAFIISIAVVVALLAFATSDTDKKLRNCLSAAKTNTSEQKVCQHDFAVTPSPTVSAKG
jgi:membrane-bound ClpP family serine protease